MANTAGEKELKRKYPCVTGLNADSKHEGRITNLVPTGHLGVYSRVLDRNKAGLSK